MSKTTHNPALNTDPPNSYSAGFPPALAAGKLHVERPLSQTPTAAFGSGAVLQGR